MIMRMMRMIVRTGFVIYSIFGFFCCWVGVIWITILLE